MKITRFLIAYSLKNDKLVEEINVDQIALEDFKKIIKPYDDDQDMLRIYKPSEDQINELRKLIPGINKWDLGQLAVYLECYSD